MLARRLSAALAAAAIGHLVFVLSTLALVAPYPPAFAIAHFTYLVAIQLGLALALGFFAGGRTWSAVVFALPIVLAAAPALKSAHGRTGFVLLAAGVLGFVAVASWGRRLRGAPILASALGSVLACWIVAHRFANVLAPDDTPGVAVIAAIVAGALALFFVTRHLPEAVALPSARQSLCLTLVAVGIAFGTASTRRASAQAVWHAAADAAERPPVVLIVLDTVRADHLALYGYSRDTMPKLEHFAQRNGVVVRRAIANSSWSLPTHASLFTGLLPPHHGAGSPRLGEVANGLMPAHPLTEGIPTLAEHLAGAGYRTLGLSSNYGYLGQHYGLHRGFQRYRADPNPSSVLRTRSPWRIPRLPFSPAASIGAALDRLPPFAWCEFFLGVNYERASAITDAALRALDELPDGPFFLFLNYMDAHDPYYPPLPFRERFPGVQPALGLHGVDWSSIMAVVRHQRALTAEEQAHLTALYDGELAYLDSELDRLLSALAQRKDWPQMMVVITSDHGEALGEHGDLTHGASLYNESVSVPLIIKPGSDPNAPAAGSELPGPFSSVDVFSTVLEHAGLPVPKNIDGLAWGRGRGRARSWLYRNKPGGVTDDRFERELRSVMIDDWKLVQRRPGTARLYHLAIDPAELHDLAAAEPERRAALESQLDTPVPVSTRPSETPNADPDVVQRLRTLGYVE